MCVCVCVCVCVSHNRTDSRARCAARTAEEKGRRLAPVVFFETGNGEVGTGGPTGTSPRFRQRTPLSRLRRRVTRVCVLSSVCVCVSRSSFYRGDVGLPRLPSPAFIVFFFFTSSFLREGAHRLASLFSSCVRVRVRVFVFFKSPSSAPLSTFKPASLSLLRLRLPHRPVPHPTFCFVVIEARSALCSHISPCFCGGGLVGVRRGAVVDVSGLVYARVCVSVTV